MKLLGAVRGLKPAAPAPSLCSWGIRPFGQLFVPDRQSRPGADHGTAPECGTGCGGRRGASGKKLCLREGHHTSAAPPPEFRAVLGMTSALPGLDRLPPLTRPELALWRASRDSLPAFHRLAWINVPRETAGRNPRTLPTSGSSPLKTERYRFRSLQGDEGRLQRGATRQDWWEPVILHRPVMAAYFSCREGRTCCVSGIDYNRFRGGALRPAALMHPTRGPAQGICRANAFPSQPLS